MTDRELLFIIRFKNAAKKQLQQLQQQLRSIAGTLKGPMAGGFKKAGVQMKKFGKLAQKAGLRVKTVGLAVRELGTSLTFFVSGPALLGLGAIIKQSLNMEDALVGVEKTVNRSKKVVRELGNEFIAMSERLPFSRDELLGVAETAAQVGVEFKNLPDFAQVVAELAISARDLNPDQAAFALARLSAVMNETDARARHLGSGIVFIGNEFAATEAEAVDVAQRFASIGRAAELGSGFVLGLAGALKALGQPSQAGSTAVQRVVIKLIEAVDQGGKKLRVFAETAGMSIGKFRKLIQEDLGEAFLQFTEGLGKLDAAKQVGALKDLQLQNQRTTKAVLALAAGQEITRDAIERTSAEVEKGTALGIEAEKFFKTFRSRFKRDFLNPMRNAAALIGEAIRPEMDAFLKQLNRLAKLAKRVAKAFQEMTDEQRKFWLILTGVLIALGPVLFLLGTFGAVLGGAIFAFGTLISVIGTVVGAFTSILVFIGPAGWIALGIIAVVAVLATFTDSWNLVGDVVKFIVNFIIKTVQVLLSVWKTEFRIMAIITKNIVGIIRAQFKKMIDPLKPILKIFKDTFTEIGKFIGEIFSWLGEKIGKFFGNVGDHISTFTANMGIDVEGAIDSFMSMLTGDPDEETVFEKVFKGVPEAAKEGMAEIREIIASDPTGALLERFKKFFTITLPETAAEGGKKAGEAVTKAIEKAVVEATPTFFDNLLESFEESQKKLRIGFETGFEDLLTNLADVEARAADAVKNMAEDIGDTFSDLVTTGTADFAELGRSILAELAKVAASNLFRTVLGALSKSLQDSEGFGGLVGQLATAAIASKGGLVEDLPRAVVPAAQFKNARRFQRGGKVGVGRDTIPALLRPGERVLTPEQQRQTGARPIQVNINIQTPDVESFRRAQGQVQAEIAAGLSRASARDG